MDTLKDKTVLVVDGGMFIEFAIRLARDFKKVYYFSPWVSEYPLSKDDMIGFGVPEIERVSDVYDYIDKVDMIAFTSIYHGDWQAYLRKKGYRVFGSGRGDELERNRVDAIEHFKDLGLMQPKYKVINGIDELTEYLADKTDKWIKVSQYRGGNETWHYLSKELSSRKLAEIKHQLGDEGKIFEFLVFDPINGDKIVECGYDTPITVDGMYPKYCLNGYEKKDCCYLGKVKRYDTLAPVITEFNEKISDTLAKYKYRNAMSTEIRTENDKKGYMIDMTCFSDDTEVLTNEGWKLFKDCTIENTFATLNLSNKNIEYQHAINYIEKEYNGRMVLLTNNKKTIECLVTPDHDVLRYDRHKKNIFKEKANEITDKGFIPRTGIYTKNDIEYFELPEYHHEWDFIGQYGHLVCTKIKHEPLLKIPMKKWASFLAWYLAEGSVSRNYIVSLSQYKHCDELEEVLKDLGFKYSKLKTGFQISSVQLATYLSKFGICNEKYIPRYILDASVDVIRCFLDNYNLADGSLDDGKKIYRTTSKFIIDGLQECIFKIGSVGNIYCNNAKGTEVLGFKKNKKIYIRNHNCYSIIERSSFSDYWFETGCRKSKYIKEVDYNGKVYCLTVPNSTLYVRRNGKPFWSGNCRIPSPPGEIYYELITNFSQMVWDAADGILTEPIYAAKYAIEVLINSCAAENGWVTVQFPEKIRKWVKLRNLAVIKGEYSIIPRHPDFNNIGAVIAIGDSIDEVVKLAKERCKLIEGEDIECKLDDITPLMEIIKKGELIGLKF